MPVGIHSHRTPHKFVEQSIASCGIMSHFSIANQPISNPNDSAIPIKLNNISWTTIQTNSHLSLTHDFYDIVPQDEATQGVCSFFPFIWNSSQCTSDWFSLIN